MTTSSAVRRPPPPSPPLTRVAEWTFLRFVRQAYGSIDGPTGAAAADRPLDLLGAGLAGQGAARPLFAWLSPLVVRGTMEWIVRRGGYQRREVVLKGRTRTGRIWEEAVWGGEAIVVGAATVRWLAAAHDAMLAMEARVASDAARALDGTAPADAAAAGAPAAPPTPPPERALDETRALPLLAGDRLALTAAFWHLLTTPATTDAASTVIASHAHRLPLLLLCFPRLVPLDGELSFTFAEDLEGLVAQYLDSAMATAWVGEIARVRVRSSADERIAAFRRLSRLLAALFAAAASGSGDHRLAAVARFYPLLWETFRGAAGVSAAVGRGAEPPHSTAEREAYERAFGDLLAFGPALDARVQQIVATPWPDRTESQKRLVTEHETRYRSIRDEVRTLSRRLRREVG